MVQDGHFFFPSRDINSGCLRTVQVHADGTAAGTAASAAAMGLSVLGGLAYGSPSAGLHALRAIRGSLCAELAVHSLLLLVIIDTRFGYFWCDAQKLSGLLFFPIFALGRRSLVDLRMPCPSFFSQLGTCSLMHRRSPMWLQ